MVDMTGKQVGDLIVTGRDNSKPKGAGKPIYWLCDCLACGSKNNSVDGRHLRRKNPQTACGCQRGGAINWLNIKQGKLLIIEDLHKATSDRHKIWKYKCDCGKEGEISSSSLKAGTQSCGCLIKEKMSEATKSNLINQKFNHLLVVEETTKRSYKGDIIWKCVCDCGKECEASTVALKSGNKKSCGCIKASKGVEIIEQILIDNNIPYEKEKRFSQCRDIYPLPFDFYINNTYVIEYDGEQHFRIVPSWGGKESFLEIQTHDTYKNNWCKENNIPIIRIPYTCKDIKLEDLLIESSQFLIKE